MRWGIGAKMTDLQLQNASNHVSPRRIAVIGGGLAGMSAAHRLQELAVESGQRLNITVFEASARLGGIVGTERIGDYLVDVGADSFLTNKPGAVSLCRRLGIEDRLVPTDARYRGALVLYDGRPVPVPEGFQLLSPTAIWPVLASPLFSAWGKLRLLMEWFIPRRPVADNNAASQAGSAPSLASLPLSDESVADFVRRRFGREALIRLIQPLVGGIYTSDPERLSLAATMPRFLEMERDYGSLIRASLRNDSRQNGKGTGAGSGVLHQDHTSSGARYGLFAGLKGGMEDLADALRKSVTSTCSVRLNTAVASIESGCAASVKPNQAPTGCDYQLTLNDGTQERFNAVIVATTGACTAQVLQTLDPKLSAELSGIEYASSALVITGHCLADISDPLRAFGLVIPHIERRRILAVSFSSRKFPDRAPVGRVLLRTFVGGALQPELFHLSDKEMIATVRSELGEILGVKGEPDFVRVYRYAHAMPQYFVGHLDRVARIEAATRQHAGLALAGIGYRGVGVPDVIACGERAAEEVFKS